MLRRQIDVLHQTADLDDPARQVEEDYRFHRLICEIAANRRLLRLFDDLASELRMVIGLIGRLYDDPHEIARTHEPVLAAIEARPSRAYRGAYRLSHRSRVARGRKTRAGDSRVAGRGCVQISFRENRSIRVKAVYTELHRSHDPQFFLVRGMVKRTTEQPERADRLLAGAEGGQARTGRADRRSGRGRVRGFTVRNIWAFSPRPGRPGPRSAMPARR